MDVLIDKPGKNEVPLPEVGVDLSIFPLDYHSWSPFSQLSRKPLSAPEGTGGRDWKVTAPKHTETGLNKIG